MATRPTFIDFRSKSHDPMMSTLPSPRGLPSPRVTHLAGDIAKTMSPLAALEAQTGMLAKQLNDSKSKGRRVSRLPPLAIANSLGSPTLEYPQSRSPQARSPEVRSPEAKSPQAISPHFIPTEREGASQGGSARADGSRTTPEAEELAFRPQSHYVRVSGMALLDNIDPPARTSLRLDEQTSQPPVATTQTDYFLTPRTHSPEPLPLHHQNTGDVRNSSPWLNPQRSFDSARQGDPSPRTKPPDLVSQRSYDSSTLAPPMSPRYRQGGSIRSVPADSSDDDLSASTGGSSFSQPRKLSSCSGVSMPQSPYPPGPGRSPSLNSEYSFGAASLPRPAFNNFSRPLSRSSRPSTEIPSRQRSFDSRPSMDSRSRQPSSDSQNQAFTDEAASRQPSSESQGRVFTDDSVHSQFSAGQGQFQGTKELQGAPAPSYIYAKFSLPRGRLLLRNSIGMEFGAPPKNDGGKSLSPPKPPIDTRSISPPSLLHSSRSHVERPRLGLDPPRIQRTPSAPVQDAKNQQSSSSTRSGSTIKARSNRTINPSTDVTAEEHLAKGIELHEQGSLKESTYHLRIAARSGLPTAMLLYALACRHGWGMRPNQQEGVQWLRKAADSAGLEVADDEGLAETKGGARGDPMERKTRRAQFAYSIYELGVSHMNGWGIEQDKGLALRCFEIASNWGDADAMAEAGFCYAQGTGCKKDSKKAAKYYRMAEAKGISMVGNSWYVLL